MKLLENRWAPLSLRTFSTHSMNLIQRALQSPDVVEVPKSLNIIFEAVEKLSDSDVATTRHRRKMQKSVKVL